MPEVKHFSYDSADRLTKIHAMMWKPEGDPVGILQIAHGMQEYIDRYDEFAKAMNENGLLVVGNDHLGHGGSIRSEAQFGYFAERGGNKALLADMRELQRRVQEEYPQLPYLLLGHSMGSFLARQYVCMYGSRLDGAIICGTAWHSSGEANMGMLLCSVLAKAKGWTYRSNLINKIAMGNFNKSFEPARTKEDWLTRDEAIVDAYRSDKRTRFVFTLNAYHSMFYGLNYLTKKQNLSKMPQNLPVLFIAGERDPVGDFGEGVKKTVVSFRDAGMKNVTCKLYPNDRHEILNELDRKDIYQDVWNWIYDIVKKQ